MAPPEKPLLVYDGRCDFCVLWIGRWKQATGGAVGYAPASEAAPAHPSIPADAYRRSVVLIRPDGSHATGALAVIESLGASAGGRFLGRLYRSLPGFGGAAEACYRWVAGHRDEMHLLTRLLWGASPEAPGFRASRWLFLRLLAVVYLFAFGSLAGQLPGLVGSNGISPVSMFLDEVFLQVGPAGALHYPTLAWIDPSDRFLSWTCGAGVVAAALLLVGAVPRLAAAACWVLYLSVSVAGQFFVDQQWDALLLEAGFLAMFFAPAGFAALRAGDAEPSRGARWLFALLLFRLVWMSGVAKLFPGDPAWWNLSALSLHLQGEPLPTPVGRAAFLLPGWILGTSAFAMLTIEIGAPFLFFAPRRLRHFGAFLVIGHQVLAAATGNFAFLNLLTAALCVTLLDDRVTARLVPRAFRPRGPAAEGTPDPAPPRPGRRRNRLSVAAGGAAFAAMLVLNSVQLAGAVVPRAFWPSPAAAAASWASRFRLVNAYALFPSPPVRRAEIVLEGSDDRIHWMEYGFIHKPSDPSTPPGWIAPLHPRLDWELCSAAYGSVADHGWVANLAIRLLEGSPQVAGLLGDDPFGGRPPRYVRALLYEYRYAYPGPRTGAQGGADPVWVRTLNSLWLAPISLDGE